MTSSSRYCHHRFFYKSPTEYPVVFIEDLIKVIQEKKIDVVLPGSDVTTISVTEHMSILEQYCKVPFSDQDVIKLAANKVHLFRLAEELGVAVLRS